MAWWAIWYEDGKREIVEKASQEDVAAHLIAVDRAVRLVKKLKAKDASEAFREMWGGEK